MADTKKATASSKRQSLDFASGDTATEDSRTIGGYTYSRDNPMGVREEGTAGPDVPDNLVQSIVARVKADSGQRQLNEEDIAIAARAEWRQGLSEGKWLIATKSRLGIG